VAGLATVFGSGAMTNSVPEIAGADALFVIGSNTTENHPIIGLRMKDAARRGAKIIIADPRKIPLVKFAHLWLRQKPGTDATLINCMMHVILQEGLEDKQFIADHTQGVDSLRKNLQSFTPEHGEKVTGVPREDIIEAARIYAEADKAGIYYTMGITQHCTGTNNVFALADLAMLTGNMGKESAGVNPLRGQNNVQGCCDMACLPNNFPGYQKVTDDSVRRKFEEAWKCELPGNIGLTATEMTDAMIRGEIKGRYVMGENPIISDPNMNHSMQAFRNLECLVVQDIFLTETAEIADVVLPAAAFAEKDGTFTNTERRVQRVRKALDSPGAAKSDLEIVSLLAKRMGYDHVLETIAKNAGLTAEEIDMAAYLPGPEETFNEVAGLWPAMGGMTYQRLNGDGLQWPCPTRSHPGTPFLYKNGFPLGRASFVTVPGLSSAEQPDDEYPLILTTGRILFHYHTGTMTRKSKALETVAPEAFIEVNEKDAEQMGIGEGELLTVTSRRGEIQVKARVGDIVGPGVVFIPFHYKEAAANLLTNDALDPICKIAEAKVCAVRVEKKNSRKNAA
jgi:formate dehydrogenase alpha subunit